MTPLEVWKNLNKRINCKHYIGPNMHKILGDYLESLDKTHVEGKQKIDKPKTDKPAKVELKKKAS